MKIIFFAALSLSDSKEPKKLNCAMAGVYQGLVSTTQLGRNCQKWNSREPHHPKHTPKVMI